MNKEENSEEIIAMVAKVIDPYTLVINKGSKDGVQMYQDFLIYEESVDEIIDPETNDILEKLEIIKGEGSVTHLQEKISTIKSSKFSNNNIFGYVALGKPNIENKREPFSDPSVGDKAKSI